MLTGLAVGVEMWIGGGWKSRLYWFIEDNPTYHGVVQEGAEGECKATWTHFGGAGLRKVAPPLSWAALKCLAAPALQPLPLPSAWRGFLPHSPAVVLNCP